MVKTGKSKIWFSLVLLNMIILSCYRQETEDHNSIKVEGPWEYISHFDLMEMGLNNHDATMPFKRINTEEFWIYLSEGGATDGKHSNIVRVKSTLLEIKKNTLEHIPVSGIPDAGVNDYNGWKAWMMNLYEIDDDEWLAVLHYEDQDEGFTEDFRMGIAYSNDGGKSFKHLGFILETTLPEKIIKEGNCTGKINIAGSGFQSDDNYLYIYFSDMNRTDRKDRHLAVARASKELVIQNAREGKNTAWYKYFERKWEEPGLGGHSADIGKLGEYHTTTIYNSYLKKWLLFNVKGGNITMRKSSNPLNFNVPDEIIYDIPSGHNVAYCSVYSTHPDPTQCGKEFYLYYRIKPAKKKVYNTEVLKISF